MEGSRNGLIEVTIETKLTGANHVKSQHKQSRSKVLNPGPVRYEVVLLTYCNLY